MQLTDHASTFEPWLRSTQDLSPHTVRAYDDDVRSFVRFLGHPFAVSDLTEAHFYRYVEHLSSERNLSPTSVRRRLSGLRRFCRWLHQEAIVDEDPMTTVHIRVSRPRRLPRAISDTDVRHLLASLTIDHRSMEQDPRSIGCTTLLAVALMIGTGMRVGELVGLQARHVDLPSRTILVLGKGMRERYVYLSNDWIVQLIRSYVGPNPAPDSPLLVNRSGRALTTAALRGRLKRTATQIGMTAPLTPHMLRHTAATQLIEAGVDIRFVQRLLGHASLTTTEIYTHVADKSLRHAVTEADVLGRVLTFR